MSKKRMLFSACMRTMEEKGMAFVGISQKKAWNEEDFSKGIFAKPLQMAFSAVIMKK